MNRLRQPAAVLAAITATALAGRAGSAPAPADSASFDCRLAASPLEKEICRTPDSRKADRGMAAAYAKALAAAPETLKPALRASQREFLAFVEPACRVAGGPVGRFRPDCVELEFESRGTELSPEASRDRRSGLTFLTLVSHYAIPARGSSADEPGADTLTVYRVQIAEPAGPAEQRWNAMIAERFDRYQRAPENRFEAGAGHMSFEIDLNGVAPGLIDSSIAVAFTPTLGRRVSSHWSTTLGRELTAKDLFTDPQMAFGFIAGIGLDEMLRTEAGDGKPPNRARMQKEILAAVVKPETWIMTAEAFSVYLEDFGIGGATFDIPWVRLWPHLKRDLPFDPAKLQ